MWIEDIDWVVSIRLVVEYIEPVLDGPMSNITFTYIYYYNITFPLAWTVHTHYGAPIMAREKKRIKRPDSTGPTLAPTPQLGPYPILDIF